ncbi:DEAD/DEAH box helicase [Olsenella massiliensis]|uniref:DEAD/DEAH box helicase n=1 Tax=Olsenella massiliensis TaxID=1622075 RepID=UPI00071E4FD1|nr:DEAD/DEAH box helicase [Olsenella massiliensis]
MDTTFAELGLNEQILEGVAALGFATPTPVQRESIPHILAGRDVVASAQTGTGKTAAFALPILQVIADASRRARLEREGERDTGDTPPSGASPAPDDIAAGPTPAGAGEGGPDVLADAVKGPGSVSIRVDDEGRLPRRRRRHHRRRSTASDGEGGEGTSRPQRTADAANPTEKAPSRPADRRKARRRRSSSRKGAPSRDACAADPNARPFGPFALVVTPTRELASQIERVVSVVCEKTGQKAVVVMGGTKFDRQIRELEAGCDLLVATPGRLIDLFEHQHVRLDEVRCLVLDEADRMLDMGFWPSVRRIVAACPRERQTLLFSATIPPSIKGTVDAMLNDPVRIEIARVGETADTVDEHLCCVTQGQKLPLLEALVARGGASGQVPERVLVFCRTKMRADMLETQLKANGRRVGVMHADRPQRARERALSEFRSGKLQVLVATDVMSRGIDVSGIDAVVNFDVPMDPEDYVHRIGRTGRAGATGHAYTFVAPDEISPLREIEYFTKKLVPLWDLEGFSYDEGRILPNPTRSTEKPTRRLFSGSRGRSRGGRYGRHY